jgi:serine/threonine kinase PknH
MADFGSKWQQPFQPVPTPRPRRRLGLIVAIVATVVVVASGIIGIISYVLLKDRNPSETPAAQSAPPPQPAPPSNPISSAPQSPQSPPPSALNGLLLSVDQINTAMNTTGMSSVGTMSAMPDNSSFVSDQACLALSAAVQAKTYAGSGYSAVQAQVVAKPQQSTVDQAVVSFPSAQDAASFFTASTQSWQACSNRQFTLAANGNSQEQTVGPVSNTNGMLSATVTPANSLGVCERALTVADKVAVDVTTCMGPQGAGVTIAHQIAAKVQ